MNWLQRIDFRNLVRAERGSRPALGLLLPGMTETSAASAGPTLEEFRTRAAHWSLIMVAAGVATVTGGFLALATAGRFTVSALDNSVDGTFTAILGVGVGVAIAALDRWRQLRSTGDPMHLAGIASVLNLTANPERIRCVEQTVSQTDASENA